MKKLGYCICIMMALLCCNYSAVAQRIFDSQVIELRRGLNDRIVQSITRDQDGYFYIVQDQSIQLWDGSNLEDIDISDISQFELLKKSKIKYLGKNKAGQALLVAKHDSLEFYNLDSQLKRLDRISTPNYQEDQVYHCGNTFYHSVFKNKETCIFELDDEYKKKPKPLIRLNGKWEINAIAITKRDTFINTTDKLIYRYKNGKLSPIDKVSGSLFCSGNKQIIAYNNEERKIWQYRDNAFLPIDLDIPEKYFLTQISADAKDQVLVAYTDNLRRYKFVSVIRPDGSTQTLDSLLVENSKINNIYADDYLDEVLMATYNGIYYYKLETDDIYTNFTNRNLKNRSDFGYIIRGVDKDAEGNLYFVGESGGLYRYNASFTQLDTLILKGTNDFRRINRIKYIPEKHAIIALGYTSVPNTSKVYRYDISSGKLTSKYHDIHVSNMQRVAEGEYMFIGRRGFKDAKAKDRRVYGLAGWLDIDNLEYKLAPICDELSTSYRMRDVEKIDDKIFLSTQQGLLVSDRFLNKIEQKVDHNTLKDLNMGSSFIIYTVAYKDKLLLGTYGQGLIVLNRSDLSLYKQMKESDGMSNNTIINHIQDHDGNIWLGTTDGITILDSNLQVKRLIREHEGISHMEFSSEGVGMGNEHLLFGSNNGYTVIHPRQYLNKKQSAGLKISKIELINDDQLQTSTYLTDLSQLKATSGSDSINIHFDYPDYYAYYSDHDREIALEINGEKQIVKSQNGIIPLSALTDGKHEIKILDVGSGNKAVIQIEAEHNLFQRWKNALIILFIGLISYLASKWYIKQNRLREQEKTAYNKKISELRLNALKSQMNPHFIFNSLGAIQYFIQTQETGRADEYLSKFAKLMRRILESSKSDYLSLKDEMELMKLYIEMEHVRFDEIFDYEVIIDDEVDPEMLIPPMIIQPLVENAINHGLYNLQDRKGKLALIVEQPDDDNVLVHIRDNGVGRKYPSKNKKPTHKSRGMEIIRDRIKIINDRKEMEVAMQFIDLEQDGTAMGTEVTVKLTYLTI